MKLHLWYHNNALASTRCLESRSFRIPDKRDSLMLINASHIKTDVNMPIVRFQIGECELYILVLCPSLTFVATRCCTNLISQNSRVKYKHVCATNVHRIMSYHIVSYRIALHYFKAAGVAAALPGISPLSELKKFSQNNFQQIT